MKTKKLIGQSKICKLCNENKDLAYFKVYHYTSIGERKRKPTCEPCRLKLRQARNAVSC